MKLNDALFNIEVNPETHEVKAKVELLTSKLFQISTMAQQYFLF